MLSSQLVNEKEAEAILKSEIMRSVNSKLPVMNDLFHVLRHAFLVCLERVNTVYMGPYRSQSDHSLYY